MLDRIQAKRALLVTQRDQMLANVNVMSGAIALCDELLQEAIQDATVEEIREGMEAVRPNAPHGMTPPPPHRMVPREEAEAYRGPL